MQIMQYKIPFSNDFDMNIIRKRVSENGFKTDKFEDLLIKAYLIRDENNQKEYCPFYIWKDYGGMNKFIFEGFYDNILNSFGWQKINIAIPLEMEFKKNIKNTTHILEIEHDYKETNKMVYPGYSLSNNDIDYLGKIIVYNPDKWKYVELYFLEDFNNKISEIGSIYEVLHMSI
ncbi:DUF4865 domain-containing protein [Floricoccus tropicus]|uniref:DUF4865 domain-containing protein n=1 Tax=Floricoccus tropicus TaxID=1859473 RepID=A0A1E8GML1_9LACT|nr:DUF4865 family protein [Floricoccus tropicus]OFI49417.1 DUF4865 domain-containing protein [Floricoccus tropicus]